MGDYVKKLLLAFGLLGTLVLMLGGCAGITAAGDKQISLGQEFNLPVGQSVTIQGENLVIKFESVIADSRCPRGAQCIWAGEAIATLIVTQSGYDSATLVVQTPVLSEPPANLVSYRSYQFTLNSLEPRPVTADLIPIDLYRATVLVERR